MIPTAASHGRRGLIRTIVIQYRPPEGVPGRELLKTVHCDAGSKIGTTVRMNLATVLGGGRGSLTVDPSARPRAPTVDGCSSLGRDFINPAYLCKAGG